MCGMQNTQDKESHVGHFDYEDVDDFEVEVEWLQKI